MSNAGSGKLARTSRSNVMPTIRSFAAWYLLVLYGAALNWWAAEGFAALIKPTDAPAWVQAVGSVAAILVVVWIDRRTELRAVRDRVAERGRVARITALVLEQNLYVVQAEVRHRLKVVESAIGLNRPRAANDEIVKPTAAKTLSRFGAATANELPDPTITAMIFDEPTATTVARTISAAKGYQRSLADGAGRLEMVEIRGAEFQTFLIELHQRLHIIENMCTDAREQLMSI